MAVTRAIVFLAALACCLPAVAAQGPARLRVAPRDQLIAPLGTLQFQALRSFFSAGIAGEQDVTTGVTWSSSDAAVVSIGAHTGLATAANITGPQTVTITATSGLLRASAMLTVSGATLTSVAVTAPNLSVALGQSAQFTATGHYSDSTQHDLSDAAMWGSASPGVAGVNQIGLALTKSQGTSVISAASGGKTGMATLTVGPAALEMIEITPANATLILPGTQQLGATGIFTDGSAHDITSQVTWKSSATGVATVSASGLVTGVAPGEADITAALQGKTATDALSVIALSSISLAPANGSLVFGTSEQFSAEGTYTDGSTRDISGSVVWNSTVPSVAIIDSSGVAQADLEGSTTIQATMNGVAGSTSLTVIDDVSIQVMPSSAEVPAGSTQQFTYTLTGASSKAVSWGVNGVPGGNSTVGTVNASGLYRAPAAVPFPATVNVSATSVAQKSRSGSAAVTVEPPPFLPLAVGNTWNYNCTIKGNPAVTPITDKVTATAMVSGHETFGLQLQFPNAPTQTFLLANDVFGNTTLYGYLVGGKVVAVTPTLYIAANPVKGESFNYPAQGGGTVHRTFVAFDVTNQTPLGVFHVAVYDESGTPTYGYNQGLGVAEQDHGSFDCVIASFQLH